MRVLVTGSAGFVGRRLVRRLEGAGHLAIGLDLPEVDITDAAGLERAVTEARPDAAIHLAAITFVPEAADDPLRTFRTNYLGTLHLLRALARHAAGTRVVVVSTSLVYGATPDAGVRFDEAAPLRPHGPYAWTKAAAERLAESDLAERLDVVCARPFNHTGAGRPESFVESSLARQLVAIALDQAPPVLRVGNLDSTRDFLHVEDVIDAYLALLEPRAPAGVYNVASGTGCRIGELVERLSRLAELAPEAVELRVEPERFRPTDHAVGSALRLHERVGWSPSRGLDPALAELVADWRERLADSR